jgi:hypothetical protein
MRSSTATWNTVITNIIKTKTMDVYNFAFTECPFELWLAVVEQEIHSSYLTFIMEEEQIIFMN